MPSHLDSLSSSPPSPTPTLNPSSFPPSAGAAGKPDPSSFSSFPLEKQGNDSSHTLDPSPLRSSLGSGDEKDGAAEMDTSKGDKDRKHDEVDGPDSTEREFDPAAAAVDEELYFPDGGVRAWAVVAGAFGMTFSTFGMTNAFGVFQQYYTSEMLADTPPSSIAWIGSMQYCLIFFPAVVMGRLLDTGTFVLPYTISAIVYTVSILLTAQCKEYYQFVLCQGLLQGISAGVMFGPTLAIVSHWFHKKRSLAYAVVACGSSIGGTIFPIMIRKLIPMIGFQWTLRACALIIGVFVSFGWFVLRPRLAPVKSKGGLFNFAAFKNLTFSLYVAGCWLVMNGLYTPITYLDVAGTRAGLGEFSSYLVAITNAFSIVGRLGPGYFADKTGPVNILIPFSFVSGILIFAWPYCTTKATLVAFSALMGISTGAFVSLFSPGVAQLGETHDIGRRMGMLTSALSFAALTGPPISGAILDKTDKFIDVAAYAGTVVLTGSCVMVLARWFLLRRLWGKM